MTLSGWYTDTAGQFEEVTDDNSGFEKRRLLAAESKPFQVLSRLHTDVGLQGRYLLNGVDIELRLIKNSNAFCLMAPRDSTYKLKIVEASFFVRKVTLSSATHLEHFKLLDKENK